MTHPHRKELWHCRICRAVLGVIDGDQVTVIHAGRQVMARLPMMQRCHKCGAMNQRERPVSEVAATATAD